METITNKTRTAMKTHFSTNFRQASRRAALRLVAAGLFAATAAPGGPSSGVKALPNHVPAAVAHSKATGILPPTGRLRLAIGLALRNTSGLDEFLAQVYDPARPALPAVSHAGAIH